MNNEIIEVKRDDLRELYQVLTNYPAISKEQVQNEMHKVFGEDTFKPKDIMERVKTFEDACRELGEDHPFVSAYTAWIKHEEFDDQEDILAYMKLRIICAALNEGWEPLRETIHQHLGRLLSYPQVSNNKSLTFKYQQFMETKNNSEFMSQVDAFSGEMQKFIEKSEGKHAVIIIASESDENGEGSRQTGYIMGNEEEVVHALVGFMRQPQGRELLKRAASLSMLDSLMKSVLNAKEQEERK